MKAQSAIEYLVTYGWAVIALGVVSGGLYSYTDSSSCNVETDVFHPDLRVEDLGVNGDNQFQMAFRSSSNDQITIKSVEVGGEDRVKQTSTLRLEPGETKAYEVAEGEESDGCAEMNVDIVYDKGAVSNQRITGNIRLPVQLVEALINFLSVGGGEIQEIKVNASLIPNSSQGLCVGDKCSSETDPSSEYVSRSGDNMTGALTVQDMELKCVGDRCGQGPQTLSGNLSDINNTMDGNLQVSNIRPLNDLSFTGFQE